MSMEALRARMAELSDLSALGRLAAWDQRTMMPPAGGPGRGEQLATLERLAHERATADEVGEWLEALEAADLDGLDAEIVRLARRDFDRARRVPGDLAAELARLQDVLLAHEDYGVLAIFQGMDGSGKDGTIKQVMSSADPQGVTVTAFKKMTHWQVK